ncbi:DUF948 domain-containing protein [Aerosakkonema sp. BLCC-F183]|uniref:DUF948 domain-containing protein n=1 Tax=Aerosakkonema sp. BLCC-F183 TaxID=3342834 RepID=UPI0035BA95D9
MIDPLFWLGFSILLVAVSLAAVLMAAIPALQEIARAARSVEKLADTLSRELPPTLEAIRLTGMEISDLTDDVSEGVKSAGVAAKQVEQSVVSAKTQAKKVQTTTRSVFSGVKAAWKTFTRSQTSPSPSVGRRSAATPLPPSQGTALDVRDRAIAPSHRASESNREIAERRNAEASHSDSEVYWSGDEAE